jgi:hypothetical protein
VGGERLDERADLHQPLSSPGAPPGGWCSRGRLKISPSAA